MARTRRRNANWRRIPWRLAISASSPPRCLPRPAREGHGGTAEERRKIGSRVDKQYRPRNETESAGDLKPGLTIMANANRGADANMFQIYDHRKGGPQARRHRRLAPQPSIRARMPKRESCSATACSFGLLRKPYSDEREFAAAADLKQHNLVPCLALNIELCGNVIRG